MMKVTSVTVKETGEEILVYGSTHGKKGRVRHPAVRLVKKDGERVTLNVIKAALRLGGDPRGAEDQGSKE